MEKTSIRSTGVIGTLLLPAHADERMVGAECFADIGGWVADQQSMDQMGFPCLLAHGLGQSVKDAQPKVSS